MNPRRVAATVLVATLATCCGMAVGQIWTSPTGTSRTVVLLTPPGRGLLKPWWESITIVDRAPNRPEPIVAVNPAPGAPAAPTPVTYVVPGDLLFGTDSATIDEAGRGDLVNLAHTQLRNAVAIVVSGATDGRGTRTHNVALSQARADAVKAVLVEAGVDPSIIRTEAWADDHPAADELGPDPATAQARNRRVEIAVTR